MEYLEITVYILLGVGIISGMSVWALLPKKWIVWSKIAAKNIPQANPAHWKSLNTLGKILTIAFYLSTALLFVVLLIGSILE